ncbi:MAG: DUF4126 domain-containing protein [Candidatus Dormibacteraeota bacterium]|nr:DUF4126 domain-containing protein [Candidatus Dormibacteraeota bacterium]
MDPRLLALPAAFGLAGASGLNATLPLLIISLLVRAGLIHLGHPLDVLGGNVAFAGILALAIVEFVADKVPAFDTVFHMIMTPAAAASGALVFASQSGAVTGVDPGFQVVIGLLVGGGLATTVHLTRAGVRPVLNLGLLGPVASFGEDVTSGLLSLSALLLPILVPVVLVLFGLGIWAVRRRWRRRARPAVST